MQPLVAIQNLEISFPENKMPAVAGISFDIMHGEMLAIAGESGSGKSLTALSINQLQPEEANLNGSILFEGKNILDQPSLIKRGKDTGNIFQDPLQALNPAYTCGRQLIESIHVHRNISSAQAKQIALELLKQVELPPTSDMLNRYPHQLSGGQQQRIMIAMAICHKPKLLIADEPTTALDASVQKGILTLLKELQRTYNMSILLISHDLKLVGKFADRTIIMQNGKIVESGLTSDILNHPKELYTQQLLAARPTFLSKGYTLPINGKAKQKLADFIPGEETMLSVEEISKTYIQKQAFKKPLFHTAVHATSFQIFQNEILGIVGESGSGKTTLGRLILRLTEPSAGKIIYKNQELTTLTGKKIKALRKDLQIVFQNPYASLNPQMTLREIISEPLKLHTKLNPLEINSRILELLSQVQLTPDLLDRYPHQFSGGQRQRIAIARALATNPKFLVFDESVSALDVSIQASVLNLIQKLREQYHFSAVFISHDLEVVHYLCDRIIVMHQGKIVETGKPDDICNSPKNSYTQKLLESVIN